MEGVGNSPAWIIAYFVEKKRMTKVSPSRIVPRYKVGYPYAANIGSRVIAAGSSGRSRETIF
jgi:hypothetical protein